MRALRAGRACRCASDNAPDASVDRIVRTMQWWSFGLCEWMRTSGMQARWLTRCAGTDRYVGRRRSEQLAPVGTVAGAGGYRLRAPDGSRARAQIRAGTDVGYAMRCAMDARRAVSSDSRRDTVASVACARAETMRAQAGATMRRPDAVCAYDDDPGRTDACASG